MQGVTCAAIAFCYFLLTVIVGWIEARRTRGSGLDITTVFVTLVLLESCVPGIFIYGLLPFVESAGPMGVPVFDRILLAVDPPTGWLVFCMTAWFLIVLYVAAAGARLALNTRGSASDHDNQLIVTFSERRLLSILLFGAALSLLSFYLLGENLVARYTNLILFRADYPEIEKTALNANAFALTQSWGWLSVVACFVCLEKHRRYTFWICLGLTLMFALLGVSRRAILLPVLLSYLTLALYRGRWRLRWIIVGAIPLIVWLSVGKELFAAIAFGGTTETVLGNYSSSIGALFRAACEVGLTIIESLGTLLFVHVPMRFGIDHVLSLAQRFPEGMLGWDFNFPERIVRISTEAFADNYSQDIPPGLFGQMWLDFRILGPVAWGIVFGLQVAVLQILFEKTQRTMQSCALFVLLIFVVALPIDTGSFDFTFSVDIIALLVSLAICVRFQNSRDPLFLPRTVSMQPVRTRV